MKQYFEIVDVMAREILDSRAGHQYLPARRPGCMKLANFVTVILKDTAVKV